MLGCHGTILCYFTYTPALMWNDLSTIYVELATRRPSVQDSRIYVVSKSEICRIHLAKIQFEAFSGCCGVSISFLQVVFNRKQMLQLLVR